MRKKILSIVPTPLLPIVSGGQKATYLRLSEMAKSNDIVVVTDVQSETEEHNFQIKPLLRGTKSFSYKNYKVINEQIKTEKPDVVLLEQTFMGIMVYSACRRNKIPYSVYSHNIEYLRFKSMQNMWWFLMFLIERFAYKHAQSLFFITNYDKEYAIKKMRLKSEKCYVATYGVTQLEPLCATSQQEQVIRTKLGIGQNDKVFMYFGLFRYFPNIQSLEVVLKNINPILQEKYGNNYKILICGGGLPESYNNLQEFEKENVIYAGFVQNINEYIQIADVILNPAQSISGIQTKVIEALGCNKNVVSTQMGVIGILEKYCTPKLSVVPNDDWDMFTAKAIEMAENNEVITPLFFDVYTWKAIAEVINTNL